MSERWRAAAVVASLLILAAVPLSRLLGQNTEREKRVVHDGKGARSTVRAPRILPPLRVTAAPGPGRVDLSWAPSGASAPIAQYRVLRRLEGARDWIAVGASRRTSYADTGAEPGSRYLYIVRAADAAGRLSRPSEAVVASSRPGGSVGEVVWKADAEEPLEDEWASIATQTDCLVPTIPGIGGGRIARVAHPRAQGTLAYRVQLRDGDDCDGERAELGQALPEKSGYPLFKEGDDRWIAYQIMIARGYPQPSRSTVSNPWNVTMQLKQIGNADSGQVAAGIYLEESRWVLYLSKYADPTKGYQSDRHDLGPLTTDVWTRFSLHVKFSPDPWMGYIEVWGDIDGNGMKLLRPGINHVTMKKDPEDRARTLDSHTRLGHYRNPAISGAATSYYDGYTVATTRAAAQTNAFSR